MMPVIILSECSISMIAVSVVRCLAIGVDCGSAAPENIRFSTGPQLNE
jgi:hypothetical protein